MAVIVPIMAMYGGFAAGAAMAAGAAVTIGGALAVAGGMIGALGLISNDKKLQRASGMFALAGGVISGLQGATSAGAGAAGSGGADAATSAAWADASAGADTLGAMGASDAAGQVAAETAAAGGAAPVAGMPAQGMMPGTENGFESSMAPKPSAGAATAAGDGASPALQQAAQSQTQQDVQALLARQQQLQAGAQGQQVQAAAPGGSNSLMDMVSGAGKWVRQNPMVANTLLNSVAGMYGPESEALDMKKSLYERARLNANSPVRMGYYPATKPAGG